MKSKVLCLFLLIGARLVSTAQTVFIPSVWINEIHYNNVGTDTMEGFEIAGTAGMDLSCFKVYLYNGANGTVYDQLTLSGSISDEGCGFGALWFGLPSNGMQNGPNDGIGLEYAPQATGCGSNHVDTVLQFLSYQGVMTATSGRLAGMTSIDIGVSQSNSTPIGKSLQVIGSPADGLAWNTMYWCADKDTTPGLLNDSQNFCGGIASQPVFEFVPTGGSFGEAAGTVYVGRVRLSNRVSPSAQVQIDMQTLSSDYSIVTGSATITLCGGNDTVPVFVTITDDALVEGNETHYLVLRNPTNGSVLGHDSLYALTIIDNDVSIPAISFQTGSMSVNESAGMVNVSVTIINPDNQSHDVDVTLGVGSATAGSDFAFTPVTLTFPALSSASQTVSFTITDDVLAEGNETFQLQLSDPTNGAVLGSDSMLTVTIQDNDVQQITVSPTAATAAENIGSVSVTVSLNIPSGANTTAQLVLDAPGTTATNGSDFLFSDTTLTWPAGTSGARVISIALMDDGVVEPDETLRLKLMNVTTGVVLVDTFYTLTITSEDTVALGVCGDLFFSEYIEGSSNNKALEIFNPKNVAVDMNGYTLLRKTNGGTITAMNLSGTIGARDVYVLANNLASPVILAAADVATGFINFNGDDAMYLLNGTDTVDALGDFNNYPGPAGWAVGSGSTQNYTLIRAYQYVDGEPDWNTASAEWMVFAQDMTDSLGAHSAAPCNTILPAQVSFDVSAMSVFEDAGNVQVHYTVTNASGSPANFDVAVTGGSAVNGTDYTFAPVSVVAPVGVSAGFAMVSIIDDAIGESSETIQFSIQNLSANAVATVGQTTLTILDNDIPTITLSPLSQTVSETDASFTITLTLNLPSAGTTTATLVYDAGSSTAINGSDFSFSSTDVTWSNGNSGPMQVTIPLINDALVEPAEMAYFKLTNVTAGVQTPDTQVVVTILSEDTVVMPTCGDLFFSEYIEGSSNNKALEIFNPQSTAVNLNGYTLLKKTNGGTVTALGLSGTVASRQVYVLVGNQAVAPLLAQADSVTSFINFNGDDALYLLKGTDTIDVIGDFNNYPGSFGWPVDFATTQNQTLIRKFDVVDGENVWSTASGEWLVFPQDMFDSLGAHHAAQCNTPLPAAINFASAAISVNEDAGTLWVHYTVTNSNANSEPFSINFLAAGSTASSVIDFNFTNQNLMAMPGNYTDSVPVSITDDLLNESSETIRLQITGLGTNAVSTVNMVVITIVDDDPIGIDESVASYRVLLWPNPATNQLRVSGNQPISAIHLYDLNGREVLRHVSDVPSVEHTIDMSDLAASIYTAEIKMNDATVRSKVVKQ